MLPTRLQLPIADFQKPSCPVQKASLRIPRHADVLVPSCAQILSPEHPARNLGRRQSAAYVCQAAAIRKAEEKGLLFGK